tara:strand:- start:137 stop:709 length:573 start_codon:yes stop_codon:yes gene_type:complete
MGLDITAISEIEPIVVPPELEIWSDEYYEWEQEQDFPGGVWNLSPNAWFPEQSEGVPLGSVISKGEEYGFRAGSYSGYNEWRNDLTYAVLGINAEDAWSRIDDGETDIPFAYLINFSDADGIIGPIASKKLYNDFVNYEDDIMKKVDYWFLKMDPHKEYSAMDMKWFQTKYNDWKQAFKVASNNGAVIFH